jgi:hypothetical protein
MDATAGTSTRDYMYAELVFVPRKNMVCPSPAVARTDPP